MTSVKEHSPQIWHLSKPPKLVQVIRTLRHYAPSWCRKFLQKATHWSRHLNVIRCYGLSRGYHDPRDRILYGSFATLVDFVEHDCAWEIQRSKGAMGRRDAVDGLAYLDWCIEESSIPGQKAFGQNAKDLYLWWTEIRPARVPWWEIVISQGSNVDKETEYEQEDQFMLSALVRIRLELWT